MKKVTVSDSEATVKDFSKNTDGTAKDGSAEVTISYSYEYEEVENELELREKFAPEALRNLANARLKSTANSAARQKAVAPYAQDPNSPDALRESMITDYMKYRKVSREVAEKHVSAMLES